MTKKVTIAQIYKLERIIAQLEALRKQLPVESDAKEQIEPALPYLIRATLMLRDELNADR